MKDIKQKRDIDITNFPQDLKQNLQALNVLIKTISQKYSISFGQTIQLIKQSEQIMIPTFILRDQKLGILESVVKYLKEEFKLPYKSIAKILDRDNRVIWITYSKAIKKKKERLEFKEPNYWIPSSLFTEKNLGPLESVSRYLVEEAQMELSQIASLLNRDSRSIWGCYNRSKQKLGKK
jgi:hypothetical protein